MADESLRNPNLNPISDVNKFAGGIYAFPSDKTFATYEASELALLPKSLFYDAASAKGTYSGLFAYYVLGVGNGRAKYHKSETQTELEKITSKSSRNPTAQQIIKEVTGGKNIPNYLNPNSPYRGQIYSVKDFIFCKYYGVIPNNRMLTLRRFAHPTMDSLRVIANDKPGDFVVTSTKDVKYDYRGETIRDLGKMLDQNAEYNTSLPVTQLVTYFGGDTGNSLSNIFSINTGLNFSMETQEPMKNENTGDPGLMNSPYGDLIKSLLVGKIGSQDIDSADKLLGTLIAPEQNINRIQRALLDEAVSADGPLSKKIFVNVNTVNQVNTRKQGFSGGTDPFTLKFHYTLNSAGEVNSKLLFLDLMTNILSLSTDYGQFLSPEIRIQQTNLGLGFPGGPAGYVKSITDPIGYVRDLVSRMLSKSEVDRQFKAEFTSDLESIANEMNQFISNPDKGIDPNSKLYKSISVFISDLFLKKIYYSPIMLSGYPTGEWHLTVGNPLNPIAMMGNLVCKNVKIDFNDELGPDDFPTEMTVQITLDPGRQRHRGDWESMFNRGNGRLYLGQLVASKESTNAWVNTKGVFVNDTAGKNIYDIVRDNVSELTGRETNSNIGQSQ